MCVLEAGRRRKTHVITRCSARSRSTRTVDALLAGWIAGIDWVIVHIRIKVDLVLVADRIDLQEACARRAASEASRTAIATAAISLRTCIGRALLVRTEMNTENDDPQPTIAPFPMYREDRILGGRSAGHRTRQAVSV